MPLVSFHELMQDARRGNYAVGYFECWNLESILAVADAAEARRSPVILGFSGIYLPHPDRLRRAPLWIYTELGFEACRNLPVPACLVYNESPDLNSVFEAIELGVNLVMYSDEGLDLSQQIERTRGVVEAAHSKNLAVEGEAAAIPGVGSNLNDVPVDARLTDLELAERFIDQTGVDAFAVNLGQAHLHGKQEVRLDLERLKKLGEVIEIPLVLHGASSVNRDDLVAAIELGIRKINVGSSLKRIYFQALQKACVDVDPDYNPYEILGSGLDNDVLLEGQIALQAKVEEFMDLFGSSGQAGEGRV